MKLEWSFLFFQIRGLLLKTPSANYFFLEAVTGAFFTAAFVGAFFAAGLLFDLAVAIIITLKFLYKCTSDMDS